MAQINDLAEPVWYVQDRGNYNGYSDFEEDAQRVDKISDVFAVFFILVAILVCLTTMTRLVEEHRTEIGTYQALGYRRLDGMKKISHLRYFSQLNRQYFRGFALRMDLPLGDL